MDTLFLFSKYIEDTSCFCLKIKDDGSLIAAPAQRSFAEIKHLNTGCNTLIIESSEQVSFFSLELSWLPERKARAAIPYALEDQLAQSVDELHFAFDRARYQKNHYLIAVISKQRMRYLMHLFSGKEINYTGITLDWFALKPEELCISETSLLIHSEDFKGELSGELANFYLKNHSSQHALQFTDSQIPIDSPLPKNCESSYTWIARRILRSPLMNLCQGEMQHGTKASLLQKGYQLSAAFFCLWLLSLVLVNAIRLHGLNNQTQKIDAQIAVIYHEFFPQAKQVISPRFRITHYLESTYSEEQNRFWLLLKQLATVMTHNRITLEQLGYQNKTLSITLVCADFAQLEALENELKKGALTVKQTQASSANQHVIASLELM